MNLIGIKRKLKPLGNPQCKGGGGGGIISGIGNAISDAVKSVGSGLASVDKAVGSSVPGGWKTLGALAATAASAGAASGSLLAEGAAVGTEAAAVGTEAALAEGATAALGEAATIGDAAAAGLDAGSAGFGASVDAATVGEIGAQGAMAAGEATGGVAVDAVGLPIEAAGKAAGSGLFSSLSGLTPLEGVMLGLTASSLLGSAQKQSQPQIPSPTPVTPPPAMKSATSPESLLSQLYGVGQGGGQMGVAQTLLSGPNGVDPKTLNLSKKTLLGA